MDFKNYNAIFDKNNYPIFKDGYPTDNGPCPCLSGKIFKECCKYEIGRCISSFGTQRLQEQYTPNNPMSIFSSKIEQTAIGKGMGKKYKKAKGKKAISFCSANKCGGCNNDTQPRYSHTLSVGVVLKNLTNISNTRNNGVVYGFNDHRMENDVKLENISYYYADYVCNEASRTCAFCQTHDSFLFSDIENPTEQYNSLDERHNLEYALKAITYDLYESVEVIKYFSELFKSFPEVAKKDQNYDFFTDYEQRVNSLFEYYEFQQRLIEDINNIKNEKSFKSELYCLSFKLPSKKVNFSLSETSILYGALCSINVVNHNDPYLIIASYTDITSLPLSEDIAKNTSKEPENEDNYLFYVEYILSNARNIYFNENVFESLEPEEKYLLYLIHRLPYKQIEQIINGCHFEDIKKMINKLLGV